MLVNRLPAALLVGMHGVLLRTTCMGLQGPGQQDFAAWQQGGVSSTSYNGFAWEAVPGIQKPSARPASTGELKLISSIDAHANARLVTEPCGTARYHLHGGLPTGLTQESAREVCIIGKQILHDP